MFVGSLFVVLVDEIVLDIVVVVGVVVVVIAGALMLVIILINGNGTSTPTISIPTITTLDRPVFSIKSQQQHDHTKRTHLIDR